jgi:hypothetical protein
MEDVLGNLCPYFESISVFEEEKLDELHTIFQEHFFNSPLFLDAKMVVIKRHPFNPLKDGLPDFYSRYYEKFVHIITRETSNKRGIKNREFREERANRIHWIKPILENYTDKRISRFKFIESNLAVREYFWYKSKNYIVVLEEVIPDYYLITGFCVDESNFKYFLRKEKAAIK